MNQPITQLTDKDTLIVEDMGIELMEAVRGVLSMAIINGATEWKISIEELNNIYQRSLKELSLIKQQGRAEGRAEMTIMAKKLLVNSEFGGRSNTYKGGYAEAISDMVHLLSQPPTTNQRHNE